MISCLCVCQCRVPQAGRGCRSCCSLEVLPCSSTTHWALGYGAEGLSQALACCCYCSCLSQWGPLGDVLQQRLLPSQMTITPSGARLLPLSSGELHGPGGTFPLVEVLHEQNPLASSPSPSSANTLLLAGTPALLLASSLNPYGAMLLVSGTSRCGSKVAAFDPKKLRGQLWGSHLQLPSWAGQSRMLLVLRMQEGRERDPHFLSLCDFSSLPCCLVQT